MVRSNADGWGTGTVIDQSSRSSLSHGERAGVRGAMALLRTFRDYCTATLGVKLHHVGKARVGRHAAIHHQAGTGNECSGVGSQK